jgi:hypothetical protein
MQRFLITYDLHAGTEEEYEDLIKALKREAPSVPRNQFGTSGMRITCETAQNYGTSFGST